MQTVDAETLLRAAFAAFQAGDYEDARTRVRRLTATGRGNGQMWALEAEASKRLEDWPAAEAAADEVIKIEPRAIRAFILKGDCRERDGDPRGATRFYNQAILLFEQAASQQPEDIRKDMARVLDRTRTAQQSYRTHLERELTDAGFDRATRSARFDQAISIMTGETQLYLQQPSMFYLPELPQRAFFEREEFAWVDDLEAQTDAIRDELTALLTDPAVFQPYLVSDPHEVRTDFHGMHDNPDWSSAYLIRDGAVIDANASRCPRTMAALQAVPMPDLAPRAPTVMFSRLAPGARIPAHHGAINTRLICHLPLVVPPGCGFRVGARTRQWETGKLLIFDDTIEHEAWNDSDQDRIVLIFDVWRPELTADEQAAIRAMFRAVDRY